MHLLRVVAVLVPLLLSGAPSAWAQPTEPAGYSSRESRIGYQRDRLAIQSGADDGYVIVDGYGRSLTIRQFTRALGDTRTYVASARASETQQVVGASATIGGPAVMLIGLSRISVGDRRSVGYQRAAGYSMLVAGMAGTAVGIGLLADRRPRMPSTYYSREQAARLVEAHNDKLRETYGLSKEEAALLTAPPRHPRAHIRVGWASAGLHVRF